MDAEALLRAGVGTPAPPALESAGAARRDEIACTSAFLTEVVRDLGPPSDIEAAAPIGLTPAELERHGPELAWLSFKATLARRQRRSPESLAAATGTPAPRIASELRAVLARPGCARLRQSLAEVAGP